MPQFVARTTFSFEGGWATRGDILDLSGYSSRSIASLMDQGLVDIFPAGLGGGGGGGGSQLVAHSVTASTVESPIVIGGPQNINAALRLSVDEAGASFFPAVYGLLTFTPVRVTRVRAGALPASHPTQTLLRVVTVSPTEEETIHGTAYGAGPGGFVSLDVQLDEVITLNSLLGDPGEQLLAVLAGVEDSTDPTRFEPSSSLEVFPEVFIEMEFV